MNPIEYRSLLRDTLLCRLLGPIPAATTRPALPGFGPAERGLLKSSSSCAPFCPQAVGDHFEIDPEPVLARGFLELGPQERAAKKPKASRRKKYPEDEYEALEIPVAAVPLLRANSMTIFLPRRIQCAARHCGKTTGGNWGAISIKLQTRRAQSGEPTAVPIRSLIRGRGAEMPSPQIPEIPKKKTKRKNPSPTVGPNWPHRGDKQGRPANTLEFCFFWPPRNRRTTISLNRCHMLGSFAIFRIQAGDVGRAGSGRLPQTNDSVVGNPFEPQDTGCRPPADEKPCSG